MDRNSQEKKDRNRELVGESFEIIGNQALCTCTNGSKPASLSVVSQQKYYCNGAAKLIATNGDKDTRSLNFGNCKARNNSPCMAAIQWNQFYDKILIGKSLCPLTMKSEGTCVCGGKITFKTSGQQVMITPPLSMREAGQVVYSNLCSYTNTRCRPIYTGEMGCNPQRKRYIGRVVRTTFAFLFYRGGGV